MQNWFNLYGKEPQILLHKLVSEAFVMAIVCTCISSLAEKNSHLLQLLQDL